MARFSLALPTLQIVFFCFLSLVLGVLLGRSSHFPTNHQLAPLLSRTYSSLPHFEGLAPDCPPSGVDPPECEKVVRDCIKRDKRRMRYGEYAKRVAVPGRGRINGLLIGDLLPELQFRPGYAYGQTDDCEDPSHLIPWLLGNQVDLNAAERRVYIDLGASLFNSSTAWFMRNYPVDFDEIHAFEKTPELFAPPYDVIAQLPHPPNVTLYEMKAGVKDKVRTSMGVPEVDFLGFVEGVLQVREEDTLIVKMDIEGDEWEVLPALLQNPTVLELIDELFVELHYSDPVMADCGWNQFKPRKLEDALRLVEKLRRAGLRTHFWP